MKTILVIYTNTKVDISNYKKRYAFNTNDNISIGDMLKSPQYATNMQVVKVLDRAFKYFNRATGDLSDEYISTNQFETRELKIASTTSVIYATKVNDPIKGAPRYVKEDKKHLDIDDDSDFSDMPDPSEDEYSEDLPF